MQTRQSIAIFHLLIFVSILHTLIPRVQSRECPLLLPLNEPTTQRSLDPFRGNLSAANEINPRIIWGSDISPTLLPYMAALFISIRGSDSFICTAIVVAPRLLITAAHCIVGLNDGTTFVPFDVADYIVAYFGAEKTSTKSATKRNIISRVPHPNYDFDDFSTYEYDIAYLNLDEDVPDGNKFMKVNSNFSNPVPGSAVRNIGYGVQRYYSNQNVYSGYDNEDDTAQQVDFPVVNYTYCDHMWKKLQEGVPDDVTVVVSRNFHICAGYLNGGCSSCYGDSGGPIFQYDSFGIPVLLGIASLTYRCGDDEVPTVFVRVSRFVSNFLPTVNLQITSSTEVVIVPEDRRAEPDYVRDSRATPSPIPNIGNGQDSPLYPGDASPSVTPGVGGLLDNSNSIGDDLPSLPTPVPSNFDESRAGDDSSSGLSGVAIAFIVLASIFVAIVILVCAYRFFHPRY